MATLQPTASAFQRPDGRSVCAAAGHQRHTSLPGGRRNDRARRIFPASYEDETDSASPDAGHLCGLHRRTRSDALAPSLLLLSSSSSSAPRAPIVVDATLAVRHHCRPSDSSSPVLVESSSERSSADNNNSLISPFPLAAKFPGQALPQRRLEESLDWQNPKRRSIQQQQHHRHLHHHHHEPLSPVASDLVVRSGETQSHVLATAETLPVAASPSVTTVTSTPLAVDVDLWPKDSSEAENLLDFDHHSIPRNTQTYTFSLTPVPEPYADNKISSSPVRSRPVSPIDWNLPVPPSEAGEPEEDPTPQDIPSLDPTYYLPDDRDRRAEEGATADDQSDSSARDGYWITATAPVSPRTEVIDENSSTGEDESGGPDLVFAYAATRASVSTFFDDDAGSAYSVHEPEEEQQALDQELEPEQVIVPATNQRLAPVVVVPAKHVPPHLDLKDAVFRNLSAAQPSPSINLNKPLPRSPGSSTFSGLFNWTLSPSPSQTEFSPAGSSCSARTESPSDETPTTIFQDSISDAYHHHHLVLHDDKANVSESYYDHYDHSTDCPSPLTQAPPAPSAATASAAEIEEMEDELKGISSELAASIRREMDLEDLVERLQADRFNPPDKRTSDYFSDSGVSSAKFSEFDQSRDELERIQRKAEQEKAQIRLDLTTKLQEERSSRRLLENQVAELSQRASQLDLAALNSRDSTGRVQELERVCEDLRRRLSEERNAKTNVEDVLAALEGDLQTAVNERDNLRDEIVPSLRARVEGLEAEASQHTNLTYESTKLQQELQTLAAENVKLRTETEAKVVGVSASASATTAMVRPEAAAAGDLDLPAPAATQPQSPAEASAALSRSLSVNRSAEAREGLSDRLKDVEAQRDALHQALKNLLDRQEYQNRESDKRIRALERERDRLLVASPRAAGFEREAASLRAEIKLLRRRAEEALEHKWQVEKGLSGLKMDLDRAEEEIELLRALLRDSDVPVPPAMVRHRRGSSVGILPIPASSAALRQCLEDLRAAHAESLERLCELEQTAGGDGLLLQQEEKTQFAMRKLELTLAGTVAGGAVETDEAVFLERERELGDELRHSARRVEELAAQVTKQLSANSGLRTRLSDMVARGDAERKSNIERINSLQARLRELEEELVSAQTSSEERVVRHEAELAALREAHAAQLRRGASPAGSRAHSTFSSRLGTPPDLTAPSPFFAPSSLSSSSSLSAGGALRSPRRLAPSRPSTRVEGGDGGNGPTADEEATSDELRRKVTELESALAEADRAMSEVVVRMSTAQIEVMMLREEGEQRDRETARLRRQLDEEKRKTFTEQFKSLSSNVGVKA